MKRNGTMEEHVKGACVRFLRDGDVFFDAGANIGYVALEVAAVYGSAVEVFAFEPQPALARNIAVSAALNGFPHVHVYAAMLGKTDDEATLFLSDDSIHASAVARREGAPALTCPRARIDTLVQSGAVKLPDVLKVDVEGGELDLFIGAATTIREHPPVIVFEADDNCERFGYAPDDLIAFLQSLAGYDFFSLNADGRLVERRPDDPSCRDLVAVPRGFESNVAARTSSPTVLHGGATR
jgi:FkbM family methyltransferase